MIPSFPSLPLIVIPSFPIVVDDLSVVGSFETTFSPPSVIVVVPLFPLTSALSVVYSADFPSVPVNLEPSTVYSAVFVSVFGFAGSVLSTLVSVTVVPVGPVTVVLVTFPSTLVVVSPSLSNLDLAPPTSFVSNEFIPVRFSANLIVRVSVPLESTVILLAAVFPLTVPSPLILTIPPRAILLAVPVFPPKVSPLSINLSIASFTVLSTKPEFAADVGSFNVPSVFLSGSFRPVILPVPFPSLSLANTMLPSFPLIEIASVPSAPLIPIDPSFPSFPLITTAAFPLSALPTSIVPPSFPLIATPSFPSAPLTTTEAPSFPSLPSVPLIVTPSAPSFP